MPDLVVTTLRGGMNNTDPAIAIPDDQCVLAQNVEFVSSMLGERRLGTAAIALPSFLSVRDRIPFGFRHLPTADETEAQCWLMGYTTSPSAATLGYKTTSWTQVTISDTPVLTGFAPYQWQAVTLHSKMHLCYRTDFDGMHTWDGTSLRRMGLAEPDPPTAADSGGAGTLAGVRYGRIRIVTVSGTTVLTRSEPSTALTFTPGGSNAAITWTRPTLPGESETHWEIELSTDNALFYMISRIAIATTTYSDTATYAAGYSSGTLSEDIGEYTRPWDARFVTVDEDRLIWGGSFEDTELDSTVGWSPVYTAPGVGNDERMDDTTTPTLALDTSRHGRLTGLSDPMMGAIWATKQHAIYKLTRTGNADKAYDADKFSDALGALEGSLVSGVDEQGQPCLYAIDQEQGPYRIGVGGIKRCGEDLRSTWNAMNVDATKVVVSRVYYPAKKQVIWNLATGSSNVPDTAIVLHVDKSRSFADGVRKGWSVWTGTRAAALRMFLFADNIEDGVARSRALVPFACLDAGEVHQCDTGIDDDDTAYAATLTTKPFVMGSILHQFEVRAAALLATAVTDAAVDVTCVRDFGLEETRTVENVTFTAADAETDVIRLLDDFKGAEMHVAQFSIADVETPAATWAINRLDILGTQGAKA